MKVLLTGGNGFIGTNLISYLSHRNHEIKVIDRLGPKVEWPEVTYCTEDIRTSHQLHELVESSDLVVNLASQLGIKFGIDNPKEQRENNFSCCQRILKICSMLDTPILHASSSAVYGDVGHPMDESMELKDNIMDHPSWNYARSKIEQEELVRYYSTEKKLKTTIIRYFNVVGKHQNDDLGHVLPSFVKRALRGEAVYVDGTGDQSRSFMHVDDACRATSLFMESFADGLTINIGSDQQIGILDLAKMVVSMTDSPSEIHFRTFEQEFCEGHRYPMVRIPDLQRLRSYGFSDERTIADAVADTIMYFKDQLIPESL